MSLNIFWFLPTHGDGHYLGTAEGARAVDHGYLTQIAQAADRLGFGGVLIPTGHSCEDSWLVAASLIPVTQRLKFLVALRPGIISPTVAARQAATLDRLSNGRALFNLVTGGDPDELAADGLNLSHAERYEAAVEFTRIWRRVLEGETVDLDGKHLQVKGAKLVHIGDTGRTDDILEHCRDADALVIEATYLEEEREMAREFAHLTARQSAELARDAGVGKLLLTHISRRYRESDVLAEAQAVFPNTHVARDFDAFQIKRGEVVKIDN